ncbi:hypothetical protein PRIPAC_93248, partial [Pristionchus pacificus]
MLSSLKKKMLPNRSKKPTLFDLLKKEDDEEKTQAQERTPLGTTCKRFRELDFELGKRKFDSIYVNWSKKCHHFTGRVAGIDYNIYGGTIEGKFAMKLDKSEAELISSILKTVTFRELGVFFEATNEYDADVIPSLFKHRDLELAKVTLCWKRSFFHDGKRARNLVMKLPPVKKLQIEFEYSDNKFKRFLNKKFGLFNEFATVDGEYVLDDATLQHITSNTNHAVIVGKSKCSAQGILNAFKIVRQSPLEKKLVFFFAPRPIIEEIISMPNLCFDNYDWNHDLIDRSSKSLLAFSEKTGA